MPQNLTDVKPDLDPSTGLPKGNPASEGKKSVMPDGRTIEDVWAENQRKTEELKGLQEELEGAQERLTELEEKAELTRKEEVEKAKLQNQSSEIETQINELYSMAEAKPYLEIVKRAVASARTEAEKVAIELDFNNDLKRANYYIEDKAKELKMTPKELAGKIGVYAVKFNHYEPSRRNELAFREYLEDQAKAKELEDREKTLKEKEDSLNFREGAGRTERDKTGTVKFEEGTKDQKLGIVRDLIG